MVKRYCCDKKHQPITKKLYWPFYLCQTGNMDYVEYVSMEYGLTTVKSAWWLLIVCCIYGGPSAFVTKTRVGRRIARRQTSCYAHYGDVIMSAIASQMTSLTIVYSTVYWGTDQRKHQSSALLAFVREIHRRPVNSPHKGPVTRKIFPFDDVIMMLDSQALYCCLPRQSAGAHLLTWINFNPNMDR